MGSWTELINELATLGDELITKLRSELAKIRQSAVDLESVKNIEVQVYGQKMPLYQLGTVTLINALTVQITPWDRKQLSELSKQLPDLLSGSAQVSVKNNSIYITYPPLTQETQERLLKEVNKVVERFRQELRRIRNTIKNRIEALKQASELSEEDYKRAISKLDEGTKKIKESLEKIGETKRKAIAE